MYYELISDSSLKIVVRSQKAGLNEIKFILQMEIIDDTARASDEERHKVWKNCPRCEQNHAMDPYSV